MIDPKMTFYGENQKIDTPFIKLNADGRYELDMEVDEVKSYILALDEALESVTAAEIEKYCVFLKNEKPAKLKEKILAGKK